MVRSILELIDPVAGHLLRCYFDHSHIDDELGT